MRRKTLMLLVSTCLVVFNVALAPAQQKPAFQSESQFGEWTTFYYQSPEPFKISAAVMFYAGSDLYRKYKNSRMPMVAFFATAVAKDDATLRKVHAEMMRTESDSAKIIYANMLWYMDTPGSRGLFKEIQTTWTKDNLQNVFRHLNAMPVRNPLENPVASPQDLDMLWAGFFASGDRAYVSRIISALDPKKYGQGAMVLIQRAARWSLKSNAGQHPQVMRICQNEYDSHKTDGIGAELKELLREITADSNRAKK